MNTNVDASMTPEQQQHLKDQYEKGNEFLRMISEFAYCLLFFSLFRITTLELFILLFNSLVFWIIYAGAREKDICLLFLGSFFSLFWFIFFIFKLIKNVTLLADPNLNIIFFIWINFLDVVTCLIFFILIGLCLKGYIVAGLIIVIDSYDEEDRTSLLKKEDTPKNDFGTIPEKEETKINVNENK